MAFLQASANICNGYKPVIARKDGLSDNPLMWRTTLSVTLSAILGSAVASFLYFLWQGVVPATSDDWRMLLAVSIAASCFTIPGSVLLAVIQFALPESVGSHQALDGIVVAIGTFVGGAILGILARDAELALVGAFYGFTTAMLFVAFQRTLGPVRERFL